MIRFNKSGEYNTPYCRKDGRFSPSYITKIINQVYNILSKLKKSSFNFFCEDFSDIINDASEEDVIYCDPPYIDRYVDYYNGWSGKDEQRLYESLSSTKAKFILSTWHHNNYRENIYIDKYWNKFNIITKEHFYFLGAKIENRNSITEALITNFNIVKRKTPTSKVSQFSLL